jgi:cell pole-organizing protein PopZ
MQSTDREPSMEDILASIKKVIAEEKELRTSDRPPEAEDEHLPEQEIGSGEEEVEVDVLELDEPLAPPVDLGPPLLDEDAVGHSREALEQLSTIAASVPATPPVNPLEEMVREMLKPILKQWLDEHLPQLVDEHVKREITRITGRPL